MRILFGKLRLYFGKYNDMENENRDNIPITEDILSRYNFWKEKDKMIFRIIPKEVYCCIYENGEDKCPLFIVRNDDAFYHVVPSISSSIECSFVKLKSLAELKTLYRVISSGSELTENTKESQTSKPKNGGCK